MGVNEHTNSQLHENRKIESINAYGRLKKFQQKGVIKMPKSQNELMKQVNNQC